MLNRIPETRLLVVTLLLAALMAGPVPAGTLAGVTKTPYFIVHYDPADKVLAESTADMARAELIRISKDLGYKPQSSEPMPLMVYGTHLAFIKAGNIEDRMTVGTARSGDETISIDASGSFLSARQITAHEVTHAIVFRILGANSYTLPLWVNEGLAKYESENSTADDEAIIAESASNGTIIPITSLTIAFPSDRSALAYAESWSAIRYLVKEHGATAPKRMLASLARDVSFDDALAKVTGQTQDQFVKGWNDSLAQRFGAARILQIGGAFLFPIMALLAVWAFIIRRRKMAQAAREWDWEEFEASMERQLREWPHR